MESSESQVVPHPQGESKITTLGAPEPGESEPLVIETEGGRYHVQWDESAPATPYGQLVFFAQFLKAGGLFSRLCASSSQRESEAEISFPRHDHRSLQAPRSHKPSQALITLGSSGFARDPADYSIHIRPPAGQRFSPTHF